MTKNLEQNTAENLFYLFLIKNPDPDTDPGTPLNRSGSTILLNGDSYNLENFDPNLKARTFYPEKRVVCCLGKK